MQRVVLQEISSSTGTGHEKLQEAENKGHTVLPQTSTQGQELIKEELSMLAADFEGFESDLANLTNTLSKWRTEIVVAHRWWVTSLICSTLTVVFVELVFSFVGLFASRGLSSQCWQSAYHLPPNLFCFCCCYFFPLLSCASDLLEFV